MIRSGRFLLLGFVSMLTLIATVPLTGCGGGGGGSSNSGVNKTNAEAPASLPAGLVGTLSWGRITFTDASHYVSVSTDSRLVGTSGTYTYAPNGTTAVVTITRSGDNVPEVHQLSSFTVTNGVYASAYDTPPNHAPYPSNQPGAITFSGTAMQYVAPSGTTTNPNSNVTAGSVYVITGRSGNDANPDPIGTQFTVTAVTSTSFTATVSGSGSIRFTLQSNGTYTGISNGVNSTLTFSNNNNTITVVATGTNPDNSAFTENYTLAKQ